MKNSLRKLCGGVGLVASITLLLASAQPARAADPYVDTAVVATTALPDADLVIVREKFYGAAGVDLSAYGISGGPHTYVQSLYFRLFVNGTASDSISYSGLVILPESVTILGIIPDKEDLGGASEDGFFTETDSLFGVGTDADAYSENSRGFEYGGGASSEYIGIIDPNTFAFALNVSIGLDDFRVIIDYGDEFAPDLSFDILGVEETA